MTSRRCSISAAAAAKLPPTKPHDRRPCHCQAATAAMPPSSCRRRPAAHTAALAPRCRSCRAAFKLPPLPSSCCRSRCDTAALSLPPTFCHHHSAKPAPQHRRRCHHAVEQQPLPPPPCCCCHQAAATAATTLTIWRHSASAGRGRGGNPIKNRVTDRKTLDS